ncbi:MAG: sensor histidine kinase [Crocinitomicaceae bacterium]|nr:sensor histidine kinase [Flavobacteriales bacterium]NQZ35327.1 sensor histidine kinase [Crocinitomicaceae bacterium]
MKITFLSQFLILCSFGTFGQSGCDTCYQYHMDLADEYNLVFQFAESITEIEFAIEIAKNEKDIERQLNAEITLAELMRRSSNHHIGLEILYAQKEHINYPEIYVRRLGRMAALYTEGKFPDNVNKHDSIYLFLEEALSISIEHNFKEEEASLRNELGALFMHKSKYKESSTHLTRSAELYQELGDSINYTRPMIWLMYNDLAFNKMKAFDEKAKKLLDWTKDKKWYALEKDLFAIVGKGFLHRGDSTGYYKWIYRSLESAVKLKKIVYSKKLASFKVLYETGKFQKELIESNFDSTQKSEQLEKEASHNRQLNLLLIMMSLLLLSTVLLIVRGIRRKRKVDKINSDLEYANEKYEILMVESNHRIKNNLQMIISLLEYSSQDVIDNGEKALKRISTKIETIGALHKHLHENVHFEKVRVDDFFNEVLNLYQHLSSEQLNVLKNIEPIEIENERIVYLGLILNELLSNTIEHNTSKVKEIKLDVIASKESCLFRYSDNNAQQEADNVGTGIVLIKKLIRRVGGTDFQVNKANGTYEFKFHV